MTVEMDPDAPPTAPPDGEPGPWRATTPPDRYAHLPAPPVDGTVPLPAPPHQLDAAPGPAPRPDVLKSLWRATRTGAQESKRRYVALTTEHDDQWMLDACKAKGAAEAFKAERVRIDADLAKRKQKYWAIVLIVYFVLTVVFFVAHARSWLIALGYLFAVAGAHVGRLAWRGRPAVARTAGTLEPIGVPPALAGTVTAHRGGPLGAFHPHQPDVDPEQTVELHRRATVTQAAPPAPAWLTQETIQERLRNAFTSLRRLPLPADDSPLIHLRGAEWTGNGWRFSVELPDESPPASQFIEDTEAVAKAWKCAADLILMSVGVRHPGILDVWVCDHDPLTGTAIWSGIQDIDETNMWDGYVLGTDVTTGEDVRYHPIGQHCLTAGGTGSGKTTLMKLKVAHLMMDPHHLTVFVDPNGGEWQIYEDVGLHFGGADGMKDALDFVRWLVDVEIERRSKRIAELKRTTRMLIGELKLYDFLARDQAEDLYPITIVLEEASRVYTDPDDGPEWYRLIGRLEGEGRKYGIQVENTFLLASKEQMGSGITIRELVTTAMAGSLRSKPAVARVLGDEWQAIGNPIRLRQYVHAGVFVVTNEGAVRSTSSKPGLLVRSRFTDDTEALVVGRKARALRQRVRPQLLPENWNRPGSAPKRSSDSKAAPGRAPAESSGPLDLGPLRRIVEILAPEGSMLATAVIAELAHRWAAQHGNLSTVVELNALLAEYDEDGKPKLRTKQPLQDDGSRPHRLAYGPCAHRLNQLESDSKYQLEHLSERPDGG